MEDLIRFRKELHTYPDLSGEEYHTQNRVRKWIARFNPSAVAEVGETGLLVSYQSEEEGPETLLRAELDALPIHEDNKMPHASVFPGKAHKCGHDGHTTILLGMAQYLSQDMPRRGAVHLLFQPAEEIGEGARAVLQDPKFNKISPDFVFALHNIPGEPMHRVLLKNGSFTPAVKSVILHLKGRTSHAAEPENGLNPALAISEIIRFAHNLQVPDPNDDAFAIITPIHIEMGEEAYGISAGEGIVRFTIRAWSSRCLREADQKLVKVANDVAQRHNLKLTTDYTQFFEANENDAGAVKLLEEAAGEAGLQVEYRKRPFKWGEDFGDFTQRFKGAMFGLGAGEKTPALHHPLYDFPDELIDSGLRMFQGLVKKLHY